MPERGSEAHHAGQPVHNEVRNVDGTVVQAGSISGGVRVRNEQHHHYQDRDRGVRRTESDSVATQCPYPGLAAFEREQARWFFGRDELVAELVALLDDRLRTGGIQVVVAPSGAGKSSLLHAGLLPKLDSGALPGSSRWPQLVFTPTAHPLTALATQIASLTEADPATVASELETDPEHGVAMLRETLRAHVGDGGDGARVVVVVDQFEELFTLCTDEQHRRAFVEVLSQVASPPETAADGQPVGLVVVGVRADFYAACLNYPPLRRALQDSPLVVGPMSVTELREAILYPAQHVGLDIEPGLVELLLGELGNTTTPAREDATPNYEAGRLPLLAHALRATWQQRHGHTLTVAGYRVTWRHPRRCREDRGSRLHQSGLSRSAGRADPVPAAGEDRRRHRRHPTHRGT